MGNSRYHNTFVGALDCDNYETGFLNASHTMTKTFKGILHNNHNGRRGEKADGKNATVGKSSENNFGPKSQSESGDHWWCMDTSFETVNLNHLK